MRLTILLLLLFVSISWADTSYAQTAKISIDAQNQTIAEILDAVEQQSEFSFIYDSKSVDTERRVTVHAEKEIIFDVLSQMFSGSDIAYTVINKKIILNKSEEILSPAQQGIRISGTVIDKDGEPLAGANIQIKGSSQGTVSIVNGTYSLMVPDGNAVLVFSYLGYMTQEISVGNNTIIDVQLSENTQLIDEVVVVGYGKLTRSTVTNAIASIKSDEFVEGATQSVYQLIQGKVAGLGINKTSGDPSSDGMQTMLRGTSTLMSSQSPLVVVDGLVGVTSYAVEDVVSIDVLKDGAAAAIYGTRANNGVIIITTKRGSSSGKFELSYHGYGAIETISKDIEGLSVSEFRNLEALTGGVIRPVDFGDNTDWNKEVFRTGFSQNHYISLSGGDQATKYYASIRYNDVNGIMKNTGRKSSYFSTGMERSMFRDKLDIGLRLAGTFANYTSVATGNVYMTSKIANPTSPVFNPDTGDYYIFGDIENPARLVNEYISHPRSLTFNFSGKATYKPITGMSITAMGGLNENRGTGATYATRAYNPSNNGQASRSASLSSVRTLELFGDYTKAFGMHTLTGLLGYSYVENNAEAFNMSTYNFPTDVFEYNRMDLGLALRDGLATMGSSKSMNKLISFFGRLNYDYMARYLFAASLRYEGSSKFGKNNRWGTFYSVSGAWRIDREEFMKSVEFLNDLKIRVGYGVTGIDPTNPYQSVMRYTYGNPTSMDGQWVYTVSPSVNSNPDLRWEEKHELNTGFDFAILDRRISGSVDYYRRSTIGLLYNYNVPVPPNLASTTLANVGELSNKGIEAVLSGVIVRKKDFNFSVTANISHNTNKVEKLSNELYQRDFLELGSTGSPVQKATHLVKEGGLVGDFYGWKSTGMDENGNWIIEGGTYGDNDIRQILGNGIPKMRAGLTTTLTYKGFDLSIMLRGAFKYQILNQFRMMRETFIKGPTYNYPKSILNKVDGHYVNVAEAYISHYIEDGDHVKIDNATLGYTFHFNGDLRSMRLYISGLNLYTFTGYQGRDPEVDMLGLTPGFDTQSGYPTTRTVSLGIKLTF